MPVGTFIWSLISSIVNQYMVLFLFFFTYRWRWWSKFGW